MKFGMTFDRGTGFCVEDMIDFEQELSANAIEKTITVEDPKTVQNVCLNIADGYPYAYQIFACMNGEKQHLVPVVRDDVRGGMDVFIGTDPEYVFETPVGFDGKITLQMQCKAVPQEEILAYVRKMIEQNRKREQYAMTIEDEVEATAAAAAATKKALLAEKEQEIIDLKEKYEKDYDELKAQKEIIEQQLSEIHGSKAWKMLMVYRRFVGIFQRLIRRIKK